MSKQPIEKVDLKALAESGIELGPNTRRVAAEIDRRNEELQEIAERGWQGVSVGTSSIAREIQELVDRRGSIGIGDLSDETGIDADVLTHYANALRNAGRIRFTTLAHPRRKEGVWTLFTKDPPQCGELGL